MPRKEAFSVLCPTGTIEVLGTVFDTVQRSEEETIITVLSGIVRYANPRGEARIKTAHTLTARPMRKPELPTQIKDYARVDWAREAKFGTRRAHLRVKKVRERAEEEIDWNHLMKSAFLGAIIGPLLVFGLIAFGLMLNIISQGLWGIDAPGREFGWIHLADDYLTMLIAYPLALGLSPGIHLGAVIGLLTRRKKK
jgi:hypothetical protein